MICWYDFETTGLDPAEDAILEVGFVLTTDDLTEILRWSSPIAYGSFAETLRVSVDPVVRDMHDANGLWGLCASDTALPLSDVEQVWLHLLDHHSDEGEEIVGAGSGVASFDLQILKAQMPAVAQRLAYFSLDAGVVRRFAQRLGVEPPEQGSHGDHRALTDAANALELWRHYETQFAGR